MTKRLSNATWVLGDKPSRTQRKQLTWTAGRTKMRQPAGGKAGGPISPSVVSRNAY